MNALHILLGVSFLVILMAFLRRKKRKARRDLSKKQVGGFLIWLWVDRLVDYILYPTTLVIFGIWWGGLIMINVTLVGNVVYILINNSTEVDWTMMSLLTKLRDKRTFVWVNEWDHLLKQTIHLPTRILRRIAICLCAFVRQLLRVRIGRFKFSNTVVFILMSIFQDSFKTVNYFFQKKADLRKPKVLLVFLASHVIANMAWLPVAGSIGAIVDYAIRFLPRIQF